MAYSIMTHDGKAHMDELLGSALLALHMGEMPEELIRENPQEIAEKLDKGRIPHHMWFIDCGLRFDPEKKFFDHHQDKELDCSALLIFDHFFKHLHDTELHHYIKLVSKVDTKGAMSLDDFHLVSESHDYYHFSQKILLKTFEDKPLLVLNLLMEGLADKIAFEQSKQIASAWRKEPGNIEIHQVESIKVLVYLNQPPSELVSPLRSELGKVVDENGISIIMSFDEKNPGARTLFRTDFGHEKIDFTKCNPKNTLFCHQGGFLLKFQPDNEEEWLKIILQSIK